MSGYSAKSGRRHLRRARGIRNECSSNLARLVAQRIFLLRLLDRRLGWSTAKLGTCQVCVPWREWRLAHVTGDNTLEKKKRDVGR